VARTTHFALHRAALDMPQVKIDSSKSTNAPSTAHFVVQDVWLGAMVPKRWAKRAVTRNAIKRQIYTVSLDFQSRLTVAAHVVRLRAGFDKNNYVSATSDALKMAVREELQLLFTRASSLVPSANIALSVA
jgi:ribonuclease P protein component